jgi:MFS family permease
MVLLLGGLPLILGFAASAVVSSMLMSANHHKIRIATYSLAVSLVATIVSAYLAGVLISVFFTGNGLESALIVWRGWHLVRGLVSIVLTLPIIVSLEKASVREVKGE